MPQNINIVSWNINSDRRVEIFDAPPHMYTANAFKDFSVHKRFPMISASLEYFRDQKKVGLFALQEVEDSILPNLVEYLKSKDLAVTTQKYNPDKMAFNFVFAYDPSIYHCNSSDQIYLTLTGKVAENPEKLTKDELFKHNLDTDFAKSSQVLTLEEIATNEQLIVVNNHFGLSNKHRLLAAEMLCQKLEKMNKQKTVPMVLVGDFNQFDSNAKEAVLYTDQIEIFKQNGFNWVSECLQTQDPKSTFVTFPYDINRFLSKEDFAKYDKLKEAKDYDGIRAFFINAIDEHNIPLVSTSLDAVFSKNPSAVSMDEEKFSPSSCKAVFFANGTRIKPTPSAAQIQQLAVDSFKAGKCVLPSDHLALFAKVNLRSTMKPLNENVHQQEETTKSRIGYNN